MEYYLTEEQTMIKDLARKISEEKVKPVRAELDEEGKFPWDLMNIFAEADLCGLYIPDKFGGFGGGSSGPRIPWRRSGISDRACRLDCPSGSRPCGPGALRQPDGGQLLRSNFRILRSFGKHPDRCQAASRGCFSRPRTGSGGRTTAQHSLVCSGRRKLHRFVFPGLQLDILVDGSDCFSFVFPRSRLGAGPVDCRITIFIGSL